MLSLAESITSLTQRGVRRSNQRVVAKAHFAVASSELVGVLPCGDPSLSPGAPGSCGCARPRHCHIRIRGLRVHASQRRCSSGLGGGAVLGGGRRSWLRDAAKVTHAGCGDDAAAAAGCFFGMLRTRVRTSLSGMKFGQKPYPALLRSSDNGVSGVVPLGGVVEYSTFAARSTDHVPR